MYLDKFYTAQAKALKRVMGSEVKTYWDGLHVLLNTISHQIVELYDDVNEPNRDIIGRCFQSLAMPLSIVTDNWFHKTEYCAVQKLESFDPSETVAQAAISLSNRSNEIRSRLNFGTGVIVNLENSNVSIVLDSAEDIKLLSAFIWASSGEIGDERFITIVISACAASQYRESASKVAKEPPMFAVFTTDLGAVDQNGMLQNYEYKLVRLNAGIDGSAFGGVGELNPSTALVRSNGDGQTTNVMGFVMNLLDICRETPENVSIAPARHIPEPSYLKRVKMRDASKFKAASIFRNSVVRFKSGSTGRVKSAANDGRTMTHQFNVRGFWRMQVCGKGRASRKLIYVKGFVKGKGLPVRKIDNKRVG
jgi:hypothetical protein